MVEELAKAYGDKVKFLGLDVHNNYDTASEFGIMSIPQLVFFKGGQEVSRLVGAVPKARIEAELQKIA